MAHHRPPAGDPAEPHTVADHPGWTVEEMLHGILHIVQDVQGRLAALERAAQRPSVPPTRRPIPRPPATPPRGAYANGDAHAD